MLSPPAIAAPTTATWWECLILTPTRFAELPMPLLRLAPPHGATVSVVMAWAAGFVHAHHWALSHRGSAAVHAPQNTSKGCHRSTGKSGPATACSTPDETDWSFFSPAQAHMGEPAWYASVAMNTPSQNAMASSCGTDLLGQPERMSRAGWLQPMGFPSASTGRCHEDVHPPVTSTNTGVWGAERPIMALRLALECRRSEPLTPYWIRAWEEELSCHGLQNKYPTLIQGFRASFDLGIPRISCTYTPPNHNLISVTTPSP